MTQRLRVDDGTNWSEVARYVRGERELLLDTGSYLGYTPPDPFGGPRLDRIHSRKRASELSRDVVETAKDLAFVSALVPRPGRTSTQDFPEAPTLWFAWCARATQRPSALRALCLLELGETRPAREHVAALLVERLPPGHKWRGNSHLQVIINRTSAALETEI